MGVTNRKEKSASGTTKPADTGVASPETPSTKEVPITKSGPEEASDDPGNHDNFFTTKKFIFVFGILLGLCLTGYVHAMGKHEDFFNDIDVYEKMNKYVDTWKEALPKNLQILLEETEQDERDEDLTAAFVVGRQAQKKGMQAKNNVIIVPGTTTSGIESWGLEGVEGCPTDSYFRKRLWGSFFMVKTLLLDKECWMKHILLDPETGLDPPGVKLRASQGFDAADYFITGYWLWSKILQNLAVIGYTPENMMMASYDWRLSYLDLEIRDGYFTQLKRSIETMKDINGEKTVLMGHSMGAQIVFYFLKWVEASGEHFGNGGKHWVNDNVAAFVDISGCLLGTPKATVALLSGEMKDTIQVRGLAMQALEKFVSRSERAHMVRSWGGIASMLPKGGDLIWGNLSGAPDDYLLDAQEDTNSSYGTLGNFLRFAHPTGEYSEKNLTIAESIDFLYEQAPDWFSRNSAEHYSTGYAKSEKELKANEKLPNHWVNPLDVPLPNAPDLNIYCFYGVGKPTERAYYYKEEKNKTAVGLNVSVDMDREVSVLFGQGDGTVSLVTHTMCHKWQQPGHNMYNPGNANVTIVEILHQPGRFDIRGGAKTADHVDILGSAEMNELLLKVASGNGASIANHYETPLKEVAKRLDATKME